jgi:hypothetical protein
MKPKQRLVEKAVKMLNSRIFLEKTERGAEAFKRDKKAWKEYQEEFGLWEGTLLDGLEEDL